MKFKLKATEGTQQIVVRFDDSYLPDVLTQVGSFLQGCGYSFGEQSLELVPWEDDKAGQDIVAAYDVLFSAAADKTRAQQHLINLCASIIEIAEDTMKQADYEAQLGK